MVDVFISYSRANQEAVRRLAEAVKRHGYDVWWDDELPPHRSYSEVITEKIAAAKAAIVVWSGGSIGSEWVRAEADLARNQKKLIQTSIDGCMPPMPFNQIQFASLADWDGDDDHSGWIKVKGSLAALCGAPADVRPAFPLPDGPPPSTPPTRVTQVVAPAPTHGPAPARPAPRRSNLLIGGLIGGSIVVLAGVGLLALTRDRGTPPAPVVAQPPAGGTRSTISDGNTQDATPAPPPAAPARAAAAPTATSPQPARTTRPAATAPRQTRREAASMPTRPRRMMPARPTPQRMPIRRARRGY